MSSARILGLHHMSAICGPAQENLDFYTGVLGLRLLKLTVNFDDPTAYHLYYGDGAGTPGTILTFFPYPNGFPGRPGTGQATVTALGVPQASLRYWVERLRARHVDVEGMRGRHLDFTAPDGLKLRLIGEADHHAAAEWDGCPIPPEHALGPMRSIVLEEEQSIGTRQMLVEQLGLTEASPGVFGFGSGTAATIEINVKEGGPKGRQGRGSVHHIAFRVADDAAQEAIREELLAAGVGVSAVVDRTYFKSIYFREPGGVLFEIATDPPGFGVDEAIESLGTSLRLPPQFEPYRAQIEKALPELHVHRRADNPF